MWTKTKPQTVPRSIGSTYHWYWEEGYRKPWITEIYSESWKLVDYKGYWWDEPIIAPPKPTFQHTIGRSRKKVNKVSEIEKKRLEIEQALRSLEEQKNES